MFWLMLRQRRRGCTSFQWRLFLCIHNPCTVCILQGECGTRRASRRAHHCATALPKVYPPVASTVDGHCDMLVPTLVSVGLLRYSFPHSRS